MPSTTRPVIAVYVAGGGVTHAGRLVGKYPSGEPRYAKLCSGVGRDRHDPFAVDAPITCKRCLAKLAEVAR